MQLGLNFQSGIKNNLKYDLPAGIVVFLVALPLCLGIALASEAPLLSGILAGVIGGVIVGAFSGSQLSVSGPAAGLAVIVAGYGKSLGSFEIFLTAVAVAGGIQILLSYMRAGAIGGIFPTSVIKGMLAAIGIIIVLKQIPHALGRDRDFEGDLGFWEAGGENTFTEIIRAFASASAGATMVFLFSVMVLLFWDRPFISRRSWSKWFPGPLAAVAAGTALNEVFHIVAPQLEILSEQGHLVTLPADSGELLGQLRFPQITALARLDVWVAGMTIGIVASIESLLSIEATDKLDPFRRIANRNRELFAQGVGNLAAAAVGGLPITSVVLRSSANIYAGGRTRFAAIFHGALLTVSVIAIPGLLNQIPLASLAAVLVLVGYKLAKVDLFKKMWKLGWGQFLPFIVTIVAIVFTDLLKGVLLGLVVGIFMVLRSNYRSAIVVIHEGRDYMIRFTKDVTFINRIALKNELAKIPEGSNVVVDGTRAFLIDHDIYDALEDYRETAKYFNINVEFRNVEGKQFPSPGMSFR